MFTQITKRIRVIKRQEDKQMQSYSFKEIKQMALRTTNERVFTWRVKQISETKAKQT